MVHGYWQRFGVWRWPFAVALYSLLASSCASNALSPLRSDQFVFSASELVTNDDPSFVSEGGESEQFPFDREVWKVDSDGGGLQNLTKNELDEWNPVVSPDRSVIAVTRWEQRSESSIDPRDLWVIDSSGLVSRQLTSNIDVIGSPVWSTDGRSLVFAGNPLGDKGIQVRGLAAIFRVNVSSPELEVLVDTPGRDVEPRLSPDGTQVAFLSTDEIRTSLWLIGTNDLDAKKVTSDLQVSVDDGVRWLPNSNDFLFVESRSQVDEYRLWKATPQGTRTQLRELGRGRLPEPDPHGEMIAFWKYIERGIEMHLIDSGTDVSRSRSVYSSLDDQNVPRGKAPLAQLSVARPVWSTDGQLLAISLTVGDIRDDPAKRPRAQTILWVIDISSDSNFSITPTPMTPFAGPLTLSWASANAAPIGQG